MTALAKSSPGKINLLLNVLQRREDGFHELETVLHPIEAADELELEVGGQGLRFTCNRPELPTDERNLVVRAANSFLARAGIDQGTQLHLEKRLPLESGLGGGSSNAATTLLLLNEAFAQPLAPAELGKLAAELGSDVPFFLQSGPALATGRGEVIEALEPFESLKAVWLFLVHPGFGVSTPWAYQQLGSFPTALNGESGRARRLIERLRKADLDGVGAELYNALEGPVLTKYPLLHMFQEYLRGLDPIGVMMSGSGSTTFSLWSGEEPARAAEKGFRAEFGENCWTSISPLFCLR